MATVQQMLDDYKSGAVTFDKLMADFAARDWTQPKSGVSLSEMYDRAEDYPGPTDIRLLESAMNTGQITYDEYAQLRRAIKKVTPT